MRALKKIVQLLAALAVTAFFISRLFIAWTTGTITIPLKRGGDVALAAEPAMFWACVAVFVVFTLCAIGGVLLFATELFTGEDLG